MIEHMFDHRETEIELSREYLSSGESHDDVTDHDIAFATTCLELADGWTEPERHHLPDGLESIPVGPYLAAVVSTVDRTRLNGHDSVRLMQAEARLSASYEAGKLATMVEVAFSPPGDAESAVERSSSEIEYASAEIAAALTLTRRAAENQLNDAVSMTGRLRRAWERFAAGHIDFRKMREFARLLGHLDNEVIDEVLDRSLDDAPALTTGQLRARVARLVVEADPDGAVSGMAEGLRERRVVTNPNPDLTGNLSIQSAHPAAIHAASQFLDKLARTLKVDGEERGLDEIRADVALDLLQGRCLCGSAPATRGGVHIEADIATLAELSDRPGELGGYGPVIAEMTRKIGLRQIDGEWTYSVTDGGRVVATGVLQRRPTAAQRRHAYADYPTCVFPGCRMPAHECDLDHRRPFSQGGPTHNDNLGPLCRHHHMTRHHAPWQLVRLPDGDHRWTSPLGHVYTRKRGPPG